MARNGKAEAIQYQESNVMDFLAARAKEVHKKDQVAHNRSVATIAGRELLFKDQLDAVFEKFLAKKYSPGKLYTVSPKLEVERILNVNLSDLHFGAALDKREVPVGYGHLEEARRIAGVAVQVASHERRHRKKTRLVLNMLGDIIQNQLHDPRDGDPLAEQFAAAVHLLSQFVAYLAGEYREIRINCTPGNHGRNVARHRDRATNQKWDAIETMIYYALKKAAAHLPNVKFFIPYTPYFTYEVFGVSVFGTHGDTVIKPGYPNRAIEVESVRKQINEINSKLEHHKRHRVFIVGHVHVASTTKLPNDTYFMSNGCLIPTDAYAQSIGIMDTACCQTMFESTPDHPVGFRREIDVDESTDKDKALDKVISKFEAF